MRAASQVYDSVEGMCLTGLTAALVARASFGLPLAGTELFLLWKQKQTAILGACRVFW